MSTGGHRQHAKTNLPRLALKYVHIIGLGVISINSIFEPCSLSNGWDDYLVSFLTTREALGPFANDRFMLKRFIPSLRHLEVKIHLLFQILQNEPDWTQPLFLTLSTMELVCLLANNLIRLNRSLLSSRHPEHQVLSLVTIFSKVVE